MKCPACNADNPDTATQCGGCGKPLPHCKACGAPLEPQVRFCRACGARVAEVAATPPAAKQPSDGADGAAGGGILGRVTQVLRRRGAQDEAPPSLGSLLVTGPRGASQEWRLTGRSETTIGREAPADLVLADGGVSRQHARVVRRGSAFDLVDLGSRNGTLVNGERLRGRHILAPGDEVEIGPFKLLARPPDSGGTVVMRSRRRANARTQLIAVAAGAVLAAAAVAAGVAVLVSRGEQPGATSAQAPANVPQSEAQQVTEAVRRVRPSVVRIRTRSAGGSGVGTGIVVEDGLIVTNEHVLTGDPHPTITLADGRDVTGQMLDADAAVDIALIRVDVSGLTPATWGDSDALQPGDRLIAIGYALGASTFTSGEPTVTSGIFSGRREFLGQTYVQTDTPINHGNSGGPLINIKGEVIGVNRLVVGRTADLQAQGLNLSIPSNVVRRLVPVLKDRSPVSGPVAGAAGRTATPTQLQTYHNGKYNYSIQYPASWKVNDSDPAQVEITGEDGLIGIYVAELKRRLSAAEYADAVVEEAKKNVQGFTVLHRNSGRLSNGTPVEILAVEWETGGKRVEGIEGIVVQGTRGYDLVGVAGSEQWSTVSGKLEEALNSFTLR